MCDIPVPIHDRENIVRAILNVHLNPKGKLKTNAFRPKAGRDDVSVMRHTYMGSDACKAKAREIVRDNPKVQYQGLAVISAKQIRDADSEVIDSREGNYCGHAHISHGIIIPPDEPPDPALDAQLRALRDAARYCPDPDPTNESWTGEYL